MTYIVILYLFGFNLLGISSPANNYNSTGNPAIHSFQLIESSSILLNIPKTYSGSEIYFDREKFSLIIKFLIPIFIVLAGFFFTKKALRNYGSVISLISAVLYFFFGLFLNVFSIIFVTGNIEGLLISVLSYAVAFTVLILAIISFFRNNGIAITILSLIVFLFDLSFQGYFSMLIIFPSIFGGIMIHMGNRQLNENT